jgi:hypothetical protein
MVSKLLAAGLDPEIELESIGGVVGEGAAAEFVGFLRLYRSLPSPDAIIMNPASADVPSDPATLYAICGALSRKSNLNNIDRVLTYSDRLPIEFNVLLVRDAVRACPVVQSSAACISWFSKHSDIIN